MFNQKYYLFSGDVEVLLDLNYYAQTAMCTQKTEILVLEMKHYERLLLKRNPKTVENLKSSLELKLKSRTSKHLQKVAPFMQHLCNKAEEHNEMKRLLSSKSNVKSKNYTPKKVSVSFDSFVPPRGPLIDIHGPGTVFYRIRKREQAKVKREKKKHAFANGPTEKSRPMMAQPLMRISLDLTHNPTVLTNDTDGAQTWPQPQPKPPPQREIKDPGLSNLEERMREWLAYDMNKPRPRPVLRKAQSQTQVREVL